MSPEEVVAAFIAAIEQRDIDAALAHLAPDCEYDNVPMSKALGHEAVRAVLGPFVQGATAVEFKVLRQAAAGRVVLNERLDRFEVNGRWIEIPVAGVWEVEGGKIALWRDYFDLAQLTSQMG